MNDFNIKNANKLLTQAGNLNQLSENIFRVHSELRDICNRISNAWQSDTEDKDSYFNKLNENIAKMKSLAAALKSLGNNLTDFALKAIAAANNGE